ncbi:glycosyltransferase family 4 protein [Acidisoma cellulosilytica]|uniref:Glycosyltransferase family 4 protein n=1 Tax=Acidisoma cellulosilyticum TaxID=2802395 RepID=A0A963Z0B5_9PROT|nr:glycosyltransferase family 4 protein [Acidisoma cellulosilyticum]MCB8880453.1 glycosyltransferase family 4 protein [Acidisoma cellulosilyticum]
MAVTWFVPGNYPPTTGAIVYDTKIGAELSAQGHAVSFVPIEGQHTWPDDPARQSAADCLKAASATGDRLVIDGFCLYAFADLAAELQAAEAIGMIHHPMSFEPHLSPEQRAFYAATEASLLPLLARIAVPSDAVAGQLATLPGLPAAQVTVITPGLPLAERSRGSEGAGCHLLAIATLIPRKGYETVLKALQPLQDLDWHLTICGDQTIDPAHTAALQALAQAPGLAGRVTFTGPCAPAAFEALWQSADIFVSGSSYEGYGMAVAEAVRRGLPLAITKGAATPDVIPDGGSIIAEPGDTVQLSKGLRRLIFDRAARQHLSDAAWAAGRELPSWADQAGLFAKLLDR